MRGRLVSRRWNRMRGKPIWRRVAWSALLLLVVCGVAAPFFLLPGFGDWSVRVSNFLTAPITSVAFSPDGVLLAVGSEDASVRLWEVATGHLRQTLHGYEGEVGAIAFSPDGALLASGSRDGTIRLWDTKTGGLMLSIGAPVRAVATSASGRWVATGHKDGTVHVWEATAGRRQHTFRHDQVAVTCLAFS